MSKTRKIIRWLVRILVVIAMVFVLVMVISPRLINLEMVRNQIKDKMLRDVGAEIQYRKLVLAYFPRPRVVIHKAKIRIPAGFTINVHRMRLFPKLLPLFRGQIDLSNIRLDYADYFMKLPQISPAAPPPDEKVSIDTIIKEVARAVKDLPEFNLPDITLKVKYGKVNLVDPYGRKFKLREVQADYHSSPDKLVFSITCKSNLWDQINISGVLNPADFKGRGKISLSRVRPQTLLAYLVPNSRLKVTDTRANLNIDFVSQGAGNLTADFDGAIPFLELDQDKQNLAFKGGRFKGKFAIGGKAVNVQFTELGLDEPQLTATGMFSYDEDLQDIRLAVNGSEINADSVRRMALALGGESETIGNIFDVIRGGYVPWISVEARGHSMADLGLLENIVIKGQMTRGRLFIPGAELDLEDVNGEALISNGILNGVNLQARMGETRGQNGTLRLGLNQAVAPFELKIHVNADLAQLPPVLNRLVDDTDFVRELAKIRDVKGSASGILSLGDDLENLATRVQVSKAELSASYDRIPYPLHLEGGHFTYEGHRIAVDKFTARIGNSILKQVSSAVDWSGTPSLEFETTSAILNLEESFSWLLSFEDYKKNLAYISSLDGNATFEEVSVKGPFFAPRNWRFKSHGSLKGVNISSNQLPRPLSIATGEFSCSQSALTLTNMDGSLGKSTISQLSANFELGKPSAFDLQSKSVNLFAGEIYPWLSSLERFKPALEDFKVTSGNLALSDINLSGRLHEPHRWHYKVDGSMQNLVVRSDAFGDPLTVNKGTFELATELYPAEPRIKLKWEPTHLTWRDSRLEFIGELAFDKNDILLDSTLSADGIDWTQIEILLDYIAKTGANRDRSSPKGQLIGTLKVLTDKFVYDTIAVEPLKAEVSFKPDRTIIAIQQAALCGINLRGLLDVNAQTLEIYIVPTALDQNLATGAACVTGVKKTATGTFNLSGEVRSKSKPAALPRALGGNLSFTAKDGRIYRLGFLAKILALLNVTEIYRGELPDLTGEGFAYRTMTARAEINGGKLLMQECSIDGVSMGIACEGNIDFAEKKMDLTVLVAPFKTVDRIVDIIPLVGHVLGGKLISFPFKAKGDLKDPIVIPLSPMAVGSGVLGIMERTLKLPITIVQPILPKGKTEPKGQKDSGSQVIPETDR